MSIPALRTTSTPPPRRPEAVPPCARCGNPKTEPLATMRLHTSDSDSWYRCDECEHVFTSSRFGDD
jgi:hypothetical protein